MPITKATQSVITPNIVTTDTRQTITGEKVIQALYSTSSTTSLTLGTGSKTLTVGTGLTWVAGRVATIRNATSTTRFMTGSVTSYDSATGVMVVNVTTVGSGTGTYTSWVVTQDSSTALPALRITSNDYGDAFVVEDSTNPDSTPFRVTSTGQIYTGAALQLGNDIELNDNSVGARGSGFRNAGSTTINQRGIIEKISNISFNSGASYYLEKQRNSINCTFNNSVVPENVFDLKDFVNLYLPIQDTLASTFSLAAGRATQLQVRILVYVYATTVATGQVVQTLGSYLSPVFVVNALTNSSQYTGFTLNNATTSTNITTVEGAAQSVGGVPASGYASIQATAATTTAHGAINLTVRGHTTADSGTTTYSSQIGVELISIYLSPSFP